MSLPETPLTRRETYLAKAAGQAVTLPETDLTREELYLRAIAEGGGGGGTSPFYPAGNTAFASLPELSADILGAMYNITDAFTTDSRFNEGAGVDYPAGTNVAVVNVGTAESPVLKYDTFAGAYVVDNALSDASENPVQNKVIKSALDGKATPADIAALINDTTAAQDKTYSSAKVEEKVAGEEITTTATGSDLTLSTAEGNINALTVYGKSEVVDGAITSAGEGYAVVDLGTLTWTIWNEFFYTGIAGRKPGAINFICEKYPTTTSGGLSDKYCTGSTSNNIVYVKDTDYTDATAFKNSLNGILLCYELSDPTQGNAIAIKTDNGSGINGTMAVFETGTPLRGIPDTDVRDVMQWDGSSGEVTKVCAKVRLADLTWSYNSQVNCFISSISNGKCQNNALGVCTKYESVAITHPSELQNKQLSVGLQYTGSGICNVLVKDTDYTTVEDFVASLGDAELVYELATPTTEQLTSTENTSIAALRTFTPQTHMSNNAGTDMTVEAYAGTANGKAVSELEDKVQSEISALKITQSGTLTLTTAGWTNNAQTVTYAHDTAKRNVIDVDPSSIEEWASCGVLATAETATSITFSCKTVPENALTFKVTSMGVN